MPSLRYVLPLFAFLIVSPLGAQSYQKELQAAVTTLRNLREETEKLMKEGQFNESNQRVMAAFPEASRTPAQALLLGNTFYRIDPKLSYALHKEAAMGLPHERDPLIEWAIEQHRAGEYAGALEIYNTISKMDRENGPIHGLAADCLIRLGRNKEAVARWKQSEEASSGTIEHFEKLVCEIYIDPGFHRRHAELRVKAQAGDMDSVVQLLVLDVNFEPDWWQRMPFRGYLKSDLLLLEKLPESPRVKAARCAAECFLLEKPTADGLREILNRAGFIVDPAKSLPEDDFLTALLFSAITDKVLTAEQVRSQFGETLVNRGLLAKNAELLNVASFVFIGQPEMLEIELKAWEVTGDARFAAGYLAERLKRNSLNVLDPALSRALKQFPENSQILAFAIALSPTPSEGLMAQGITSEYRRFSSAGALQRPNSQALAAYFARLAAIAK